MGTNTVRQLAVGWATASITPDTPVQLSGQFHERISTGVRDPVTATALALEASDDPGSTGQAIIVSCDLVQVPRELHDQVRAAVGPRMPGFDPTRIFLAATHTHTAPNLIDNEWYPPARPGVMGGAEYQRFLVPRLAGIVVEAWNSRRAGGVSRVLGRAAVGYNRRVVYTDGRAEMYGSTDRPDFLCMEGGEDHGLEMLCFRDAAGSLTGLVINIACPSQVVEGMEYVSADYWGEVRKELSRRHGPNLHLLPLCAAAGDQSPRDLVRRGRGEADFYDESGMVEIGRRIADAVDAMLPEAQKAIHSDVTLKHVVRELTLPGLVITREHADASRAVCQAKVKEGPIVPGSPEYGVLRCHQSLVERFEHQPARPRFGMELHVLRLGDIALCTNPFELFLDYGLRMKARSKAVQTLVVQLAGPSDSAGYLPTARGLDGGHYSAQVTDCPVGPEGGQVLVDETVALINALWADEIR